MSALNISMTELAMLRKETNVAELFEISNNNSAMLYLKLCCLMCVGEAWPIRLGGVASD